MPSSATNGVPSLTKLLRRCLHRFPLASHSSLSFSKHIDNLDHASNPNVKGRSMQCVGPNARSSGAHVNSNVVTACPCSRKCFARAMLGPRKTWSVRMLLSWETGVSGEAKCENTLPSSAVQPIKTCLLSVGPSSFSKPGGIVVVGPQMDSVPGLATIAFV